MPRKPSKQEQVEEAQQAARERAALHFTDDSDIAPDVPPPESGESGLTTGYVFNTYSKRAEIACSSSYSHSVGRTDKTTSQHSIYMFSTRERALRALRVALEREFAAELAKIDKMLEGA